MSRQKRILRRRWPGFCGGGLAPSRRWPGIGRPAQMELIAPLRGLIGYWGRRCDDRKARKHSGDGRAPSPNGASDLERAASTGAPRPAGQGASERQGRSGRCAASQKAQVGASVGSQAARWAAGERACVSSAQSAGSAKAASLSGRSLAAPAGRLNLQTRDRGARPPSSGGSSAAIQ
jgi:hypothetical protein